jgi:hypothetical protein
MIMMKKVNWHFSRTDLALKYLKIVYQGAINRIARCTQDWQNIIFTKKFLSDSIRARFIPIYINLWSDPDNPALTILSAFRPRLCAALPRHLATTFRLGL